MDQSICIKVCSLFFTKYLDVHVSFVILDPINIIGSSGGDVENRSIINNFSASGELQLICASTEGYEYPEWMLLKQTGTFQQNIVCNTDYHCYLMLSNPSDDLSLQLRCQSGDNFLYKDVTVIKRKL